MGDSMKKKVFKIKHSEYCLTHYYNFQSIIDSKGKRVESGQVIGNSGRSGGSVKPMLSFEILKENVPLNPVIVYIVIN